MGRRDQQGARESDELFAGDDARTPEPSAPSPVIGELRGLAGPGGRVSVRVGGLRVATLRESTVRGLGLYVGQEWTAHLAVLVAAGERADRAQREGERFVSRRMRSEASVRAHLRAKGHDEGATAEAINRLRAGGAINDAALAQAIARSATRRGPASRRSILEKGADAGVAPEALEEALRDGRAAGDEESAVRVVREKLPGWLESHGAQGGARRALALLARKGFDREDAERAVRVVLEEHGAPAPEDWS